VTVVYSSSELFTIIRLAEKGHLSNESKVTFSNPEQKCNQNYCGK
jgi:hypothetical protein